MLEHATYLKSVDLQLHHNMVLTISTTLVGTNTTKVLEGMFGVILPARDEEEEEEVEHVIGGEEEQLPEVGTITQAAAYSADVAVFSQPPASSSITTPK